jgi:hypothetical protein
MDGATAAERICPWRRSSIPDSVRSASTSPTNERSSHTQASSNTADPNLHSSPITSSSFSGAFNKSSEYMGEYATTTKPEEHSTRPHMRDIFNNQSRTGDEKKENDNEYASDESSTRL